MQFGEDISQEEQILAEELKKHLANKTDIKDDFYWDTNNWGKWLQLSYRRYEMFLLCNQEILIEWEHQLSQLDNNKRRILHTVNQINQVTLPFVETKNSTRFEKRNLEKGVCVITPPVLSTEGKRTISKIFSGFSELCDLLNEDDQSTE